MKSLLSLFLILATSACSLGGKIGATPTQPATSTREATATASATLTRTATATSTATTTPTHTPTATSTVTPSPMPTATPVGLYSHYDAGFSLIFPSSWDVVEKSSDHLILSDSRSELTMIAYSFPADEEMSITDFVEEFLNGVFEDNLPDLLEETQTELANNLLADTRDYLVSISGNEIMARFVYVDTGTRYYVFIVFGEQSTIQERQQTLSRMFGSIQLFRPRPFGLDRNETITILGGDPIPEYIDPATTTGAASGYVGFLFSGLVRLSPQVQIEADLAESWNISPDGTVYTFMLRPDLKFASGREITAQDVKDSWERAADPETGSTTARTYLGDIVGVNARLDGEAEEISGVKVIDDRTLEVRLDGPKPYFLAKLTYPTSFVVDTEEVMASPDDWTLDPNASGPYEIKDFQENEAIVFERNENYHNLPAIRYIHVILFVGGSPVSLFEEGSLDILYLSGDDALRARKSDDPLHADWTSTSSLCTSYLALNNNVPPLDDVNVRKALVMAIDPAQYVDIITQDTSLAATSILPPAMPGFNQASTGYTFDPEGARSALNASKYAGNLPTLTLSASGTGDSQRDDISLLVEMWRANLGIEVQVEYLDSDRFTQATRENHAQIVDFGWCADYPDPENFLDILFHTGNEFNTASYSNPEVDALLEQARTELDAETRLGLYQQVETLLLQDAAAIPLAYGVYDVVVNPRVQNYFLSPLHAAEIQWLSLSPEAP